MTNHHHRPREPPVTAPGTARTNLTDHDDQENDSDFDDTPGPPSAWHARPIREL
ncbi:hypothetical protein [Corynebacterium variabile]|uniref:Uncharacterized protein n=1 Tax=Corynebacterium variabile TaxID=1727 RepID=A0A4Y4C3C5_9CORY|nr:hypothetical protein [Corynebacterium variabile]GEC87531.1 hypothetical protein CVA01_28450 [Corynebacterium variabile]